MLEKFIFIYLFHFLLTQSIRAQTVGTGGNTGDFLMNNPTAGLAGNIVGPDINSVSSAQAIGNIDHMGLLNTMANGPNIQEPIAFSLANQGVTDDVMRSARGALVGGFGNPMISTDGFIGSPVSASHFNGGLTDMADGVIGGPLMGGLKGPIDAITSVSQPIRDLIATGPAPELLRVPINIGAADEKNADSLLNAAVAANTAVSPMTSRAIPSNTITAINMANGIANGPITNRILGEANNIAVSNRLVNPITMGAIANNLHNPTGIPTSSITKVPNLSVGNGLTSQGLLTNTATFPNRNLAESKSILASITGIDPAHLGTKTRFKVKSASPITPTGLTIQADNLLMEGKLAVTGKLPFLSAVTVDGVFPDGGKGTVKYECGNGNIGILNEIPGPATTGPIAAGFGINTAVPNVFPNVGTNRLS